MKLRRSFTGLVLTGVALAGLGVSAPDAHARSGTGCDGTSPVSTGCSRTGQLINERTIWSYDGKNRGKVQVWYSTSCKTNWVRTYTSTNSTSDKFIKRPAQNGLRAFSDREVDKVAGWSYTMQVYAPGRTRIDVSGVISGPPTPGMYSFSLT